MKRQHLFLGIIVLFFLFTRLFKITQIPKSLYWDEASIGYNAYSVGVDGKDEWGSFLPLHFRAFGEFKLPVYVYSVAIVEKIFGPSIFSVRLPAVIFSLISLFLLYLISKRLFGEEVGLYSSLVFALLPWNFIFSRTGYEVNAGMMLFLLGVYLFLMTEKKAYFFLLSTVSFILSFYSYNSFRMLSPVFLAVFGFLFILRKEIKIKDKVIYVVISVVLFLVALLPVYRLYKYDAGASRLAQVQAGESVQVIKNYFSHFSPKFLFISGDANLRSNNPGFGELYWISAPFILIGVYAIFKKRPKYWWLPLLGIFLGPIPAAITKESPHALRSILMFPFFAIVIGVGLKYLTVYFKKSKMIGEFILIILFLLSFEKYFTDFLSEYPVKSAFDWQYGYSQIIDNYSSDFDLYKKIVISDQYAQPYIFALFYQKYDPVSFRKSVVYNPVSNWGFSTVLGFDNLIFKKIEATDLLKGNLVFATDSDKIKDTSPIGEIKNPDGSASFWIYSK